MERRKVLFFRPILHDFQLNDERLMHSLMETRDSFPKLPSSSYEFHLGKSNPLNIRHLIPLKVILHSNCLVRKSRGIYPSIKRGYIDFHLSSNIRLTLMNTSTLSFKAWMPRLPIVTYPLAISRFIKSKVPMAPLVTPQSSPLHLRVRWGRWF